MDQESRSPRSGAWSTRSSGAREWPGKIRTTMQFLRNYKQRHLPRRRAGRSRRIPRTSTEARARGRRNGGHRPRTTARACADSRTRCCAVSSASGAAIVGPVRKANDRMRERDHQEPAPARHHPATSPAKARKSGSSSTTAPTACCASSSHSPMPGVIRMLDVALDTDRQPHLRRRRGRPERSRAGARRRPSAERWFFCRATRVTSTT